MNLGKQPTQVLEVTQNHLDEEITESRHPDKGLEGGPGLQAGTSLGLQGPPTPGQDPGEPDLRMVLLFILAQEALRKDSWRKGFLPKKRLFQERLHFYGGKNSLFANHLPKSISLL